eukprot:3312139-Prymnesium_polylepis.1
MCWVQTTHGACASALRRPSADPGHMTIVAVAECKLWLVDRPEHDSPPHAPAQKRARVACAASA